MTVEIQKRLVIVSNRLPIVFEKHYGKWQVSQGSGGLVTALASVLRDRGGLWIGWSGGPYEAEIAQSLSAATKDIEYSLKPVALTDNDIEKYYHGFSNEIIWPLFHDLQSRCNFNPDYWITYQSVNKKFALAIIENTKNDDYIWIHDYHLMNVAQELHALKSSHKIGFFLHIPFPPLDIFIKLPWRFELLNALLEFDLIGFQTLRDRRNFIQCVRSLIKNVRLYGKGQIVTIKSKEHKLKIGSFPIGIDYKNFVEQTETKEVADSAWYIHENMGERQIILGVDRLDYTKGLIERLNAFEKALIKYPELKGKVTFFQIVVPSRTTIPEYQMLRTEIEKMVGNINGRFTKYGWVPIQYIFRSLDRYELIAYYRTSEIALITPLKDGMNLVAKEYCACSKENGVIILSEFAGASAQMQNGAIMVNPYDVESVADAIYQAFNMPPEERKIRMKKLQQSVKRSDIFWWVDSFLRAAFTENLYNFPVFEDSDYISAPETVEKDSG